MSMASQKQVGDSRHQFSEAEMKRYFSRAPTPAIMATIVGALLAIFGIIGNTFQTPLIFVGLGLLIIGSAIITHRVLAPKPTDQEYDIWLNAQAQAIISCAISKLGLDSSQTPGVPLQLHGFVLPGMGDSERYHAEELRWKIGRDRISRFSLNVYMCFFPADDYLVTLVIDFNALNQSAHNEISETYFYPRIVGLAVNDERDYIMLEGKQYPYLIRRFSLRISGRDSIDVSTRATPMDNRQILEGSSLGISAGATPIDKRQNVPSFIIPNSDMDQSIIQLRMLLLERKRSVTDKRSFFSYIKQIIEDLLKLIESDMPLDKSGYLQNQIEKLLKEFSAAVGLRVAGKQEFKDLIAFFIEIGDIFEDIRMPDQLPFLISTGHEISNETTENLSHFLRGHSSKSQVAILILFCDKHKLDLAKQHFANNRLGNVYALDIVVFNHENLLEIVSAEKPADEFRSYVLPQVNLVAVSPYALAGPTSPKFFFGRERELRQISDHLDTTSYMLVGSRRIGKTSMLNRLHYGYLPFPTLLFDCSAFSSYDAMLSATIRDWQPAPPPNVPATFGELLKYLPIDKRVVLLLDEADKMVPIDRANGYQLFNSLRALVNAGRIQIILSGERTLREAVKDSTSPLFNFAYLMLLGPLDYDAVNQLVTGPMKMLGVEIVNQNAVVDYIYEFTSGHPNIIQILCHNLIEKLNNQGTRRITLHEVRAITEDPHFQEYDFLQIYWEGATLLEQIITLVLSHEAREYHLKAVRQMLYEHARIQPSATDTKDALDHLVELRSILRRTPNGYEFAVKAFPLVLRNTTTIEDLLEVKVEQYTSQEGYSV